MSGREELPRGVQRLTNGKLKVTMSQKTGSRRTVSAVFTTRDAAVRALDEARRARANGQDVGAVLHAAQVSEIGDADAPGPTPVAARRVPPAPPAAGTARRFGDVLDEFKARRSEVERVSDPTIPGTRRRGVASLRPGTIRVENNGIENHLRPQFGSLPMDEITNAVVREFVVRLAGLGYCAAFQDNLLIQLRQIIGEEPRSARPEEFPWNRVRPMAPKNPSD